MVNPPKLIEESGNSGPIEAHANGDAFLRIKLESTNISVYFVRVEDPGIAKGIRCLIGIKLREENGNYLELTGFDILSTSKVSLTNYQEIEDYVNENKVKIINTKIPWNKVVEIKNNSFVYKNNNITKK